MSNYATLKASVNSIITTNGNNEITGALLNGLLNSIIDSLGAQYQLVGVAMPETTPGTPDYNVAYIAAPGTYPNFNALRVPAGYLGIFKYNGAWVLDLLYTGVGYLYSDISNALYAIRAYPGGTQPYDNPEGTRIRVIFSVPAGTIVKASTTLATGIAGGLFTTLSEAVRAPASGDSVLQVFTNGYVSGFEGVTNSSGYLTLSLTNGNTVISEELKAEMLASITVEIRAGVYAEMGQKVSYDDIAYNLTTTTEKKVLAAQMGNVLSRMIGEIPPAMFFEQLGATLEDITVYNGYDSRNATQSVTNRTPFVINKDLTGVYLIKGVRVNISRAGTITISKVKRTDVAISAPGDRSVFYEKRVFTATSTGAQVFELDNFLLSDDEYLAVGDVTDTALFLYGNYSPGDRMFLYIASNVWNRASSSLNVDVLAQEVVIEGGRALIESVYRGKVFSFLGDSVTTYSGYIPSGNETYYPSGDVNSVDKTWWRKLLDAFGATLGINNSWSGSRVTTTNGETSAGCMTRCQNLGTPNVIIVFMGYNDFNNNVELGDYHGETALPSDTTKFTEAYAIMLNKILTAYPTAEVYVCTLPQCERTNPTGFPEINGSGVSLKQYNEAIIELALAFGVNVVDMNKSGLTYQNMSVYNPNQLHPNALGHSVMANRAIKDLDGAIALRYNVLP